MMYRYPSHMTPEEADLYVDAARRKYGESNLRGVDIELNGSNVEITVRLVEDPRMRLKRLSVDFRNELNKERMIAAHENIGSGWADRERAGGYAG